MAVVMCMILTACGNGSSDKKEKYSKYKELYNYLEDGDYDSAFAYIVEHSEKAEENNRYENDFGDNIQSGKNELPEEVAERIDVMYGEWKPLYTGDAEKITSVSINRDGGFICDEQILSWKYTSEGTYNNWRCYWFDLFEADKKAGSFYLIFYDNSDIEIHLSFEGACNPEDWIELYRPSYYEVIDITMDNWQDYFEVEYSMSFDENEFGEYTNSDISAYFVLKDEYRGRFSDILFCESYEEKVIESGAVEFAYEYGKKSITFDPVEKTYSFDGTFVSEGESTSIIGFYLYSDNTSIAAYVSSVYYSADELADGIVDYFKENIRPIRIKLQLYMLPDANS